MVVKAGSSFESLPADGGKASCSNKSPPFAAAPCGIREAPRQRLSRKRGNRRASLAGVVLLGGEVTSECLKGNASPGTSDVGLWPCNRAFGSPLPQAQGASCWKSVTRGSSQRCD